MKRAFFVLVVLLACFEASHARRDDNPYSHANRESFVASCERSGGTETSCGCAFDWIKTNVAVADYKAYEHLVTSPGYTDAQMPAWALQAIEACRPAANAAAST